MPFRSAVRFRKNAILITGPSGSEVSYDKGEHWTTVVGQGFHTMDIGKDGTVWAAGSEGRIGKLQTDK